MTDRVTPTRERVRNFGFLFGGVGLLLAAWMVYRGNPHWAWPLVAGAVFALSGLFAYPVLRPVYIAWMGLAAALGWINTRLLLGVFFYLVMTPFGCIMRLLGKDPLERKADRAARSYWVARPRRDFDARSYEKQF